MAAPLLFKMKIVLTVKGVAGTSCETTIKANRRTAEYRMSNIEGWNRFAKSFLNKIDRIQ
jgi:hypothetical protein